MKELKRVDILSSGKISLMFGVVFGIFMALSMFGFGSVIGSLSAISGEGAEAEAVGRLTMNIMAVTYLFVTPIVCFISGVIYALIYNISAKLVGGIKWEEKETPKS